MVIVDVDGSISGVPNSSIISNHPFMLTGGETRPSEWTNTYRSDNRFAQCRLEYGVPHGSFPDVSVVRTKPGTPTRGVYYINGYNEWHQLPLIVRKDFLYTYSYPILPSTKKVIVNFEDAEAGAHSVLRFKDFGKLGSLTVSGMTSYSSLANLKAGSTSGFYREPNGDLYLRPVATAARHSYTIAWSSNGAYTPLILDSDGDGTSDGDEAAAGTDPFRTVNGTDPFVDTEFNVAGNFENWDSFSGIINEAVASNGTMSGRSSSTDPQMFSRNLRIDGNAVPALLVRFKASANGAAQFSWKKLNDTDFTTARSVSVHYHGNDQWQTLVFPMGSNAEWQNQVITDLRFDPVAAENVDFQMDYIRGSTTVPISISTVPDQTIPINSSTGQVAVTVGYGTNDPSPLQLSATSSNPTLVPSSGIVFAGSAANRAIAVTPAAYQFGSSLITISVSDGQLTTSSTFTVTVTQPVPTDRTWSGAGGNNNWSTGANWGGTAPLPSDPLFFAGTTRLTPNNDLPADLSFAGIQFNSAAGAFTLSGNRITLGGNITFSGNPASAVTQTINLDMLLSDNRTITTRSTGPITIGGIIDDGASGFGLNKTGLGTLTLTGPNTFDGQVTIGNGTLAVSRIANVGTASSLGDATGADSIIRLGTSNNEGILSYIGTTAASTDRQVQINTGPATIGNSAVDSNHALVFTHPTFNAQSATATAYTLTLNGTNTGNNEVQGIMQDNTTTAVSLTKASTGKWIVSGVNTFSGRVFVDSGILSINTLANVGTASSLGTGSTTPTIQFGTGTRTGTLEYTGIGGTAGETNRQIQIGSTTANHAGGGVILNNGTTGALTFSNPAFNAPVAGVTATRTLTLGGGNTDANTISGVITNNGSGKINLVKTDAGTWVLGGTNTYTGTTTVTGGTLALGANNVLPNSSAMTIGTATLDAATFGDTLGTLDTTGSAVINLGSGAALAFADSKAIDWTGGTLSITGTFVSGSSLRFGTSSAGLTAAQLAKISKPGGGPVALNASGYLINGPFLSVTGTPLAAVNTTYGTPSPSSTNFTLAGIGLSPASGNVLVAALSGYEYALIEGGPYTATLSLPYSGGTLPSTQVFVRLTATATVAGSPYAGNIVVSGGGAASLSIATVPSAVSKATPTVTVTPGTYTYNGSAQGPTAYTTSPAGHTGTPTWSYVGTGATNYPANATQPTAAGTYTATVSLATDNNFETASSPATAFTIANGDPYLAWSEGAPFDADANNDGVKNGLAWLLGAADPNASATRLLPTALHEDGDLVLTFRMRNEAGRGGAVLQLQHCNDLGGSTGWCTSVTIPEQSDTQAGVTFTITPNGDMNDVEASIPSTESAAGRLFGRLNGVSAP
jgi:autotransporter-associated beta strand protein